MKFDEHCPKRKPSNSQVHVHAEITFQFEKKPIKLYHELSSLGRQEHELILFYRIFSGLVPTYLKDLFKLCIFPETTYPL